MGASDYDLLRRYWYEESWGTYRDNLHAAIIAREVRRTTFKGEHKLADFMFQRPERRRADERSGVFNLFRALAHKVKRK